MLGNSQYCTKYLCANAGLYTFYNNLVDYPYGIKNLDQFHQRINDSLTKDVYILAGEQDVKTKYLNNLPMDMEEGKTRYERAINYFNSARKYAQNNSIKMNWTFVSMPNVGHDNRQVLPYAVEVINKK